MPGKSNQINLNLKQFLNTGLAYCVKCKKM